MRRLRFEDAKVGDIINVWCMDDCRCTGRIKETMPDINRVRFKGLEPGDCGSVVLNHPQRKIFLIYRPEPWEEIELERDPPIDDMWGFGLAQARAAAAFTGTTEIAATAAFTIDPPPPPDEVREWQEPVFRIHREEQEHHRRAGVEQVLRRRAPLGRRGLGWRE